VENREGNTSWGPAMRALLSSLAMFTGVLIDLSAQESCPKPAGERIPVSRGVRLHVIDWGGKGEPVIFLSGLQASAHVFDDFAPLFAESHRVIGITRRGIPPSDPSRTGYSQTLLTGDVIAVMDSLKISAAHVVGWSYGGGEATLLAVASPNRVLSLTLLDSYDRSARPRAPGATASRSPPAPPPFVRLDSLSPLSLQWREQRLGSRPAPLSLICTLNRFARDGRYLGPVLTASARDSVLAALRQAIPRHPYSEVRQPVLALFAVPRGVGDRYPAYAVMSPADRQLADSVFAAAIEEMDAARARLRIEIPHAKVIEIPGAAHALFRSHPEAVFLHLLRFLAAPRKAATER
jgi:non-heme chloroperoxidase